MLDFDAFAGLLDGSPGCGGELDGVWWSAPGFDCADSIGRGDFRIESDDDGITVIIDATTGHCGAGGAREAVVEEPLLTFTECSALWLAHKQGRSKAYIRENRVFCETADQNRTATKMVIAVAGVDDAALAGLLSVGDVIGWLEERPTAFGKGEKVRKIPLSVATREAKKNGKPCGRSPLSIDRWRKQVRAFLSFPEATLQALISAGRQKTQIDRVDQVQLRLEAGVESNGTPCS